MLTTYISEEGKLKKSQGSPDELPSFPLWLDLLHPTSDEKHLVAKKLEIDLPTRQDMGEIEASSRTYSEGDALFMTATLLAGSETERPQAAPITFIITGTTLVTIRYSEPRSFDMFLFRAHRSPGFYLSAQHIFIGLLESITDRNADILERIAAAIESLSHEVFQDRTRSSGKTRSLQEILGEIGQKGHLNSQVHESLASLARFLSFVNGKFASHEAGREIRARLKTVSGDLDSLREDVSFLSHKVGFLLDAVLGMINIEQSGIIKIFSVAAVVFLPPTLIASIYGMNFRNMPELEWPLGYPIAVIIMVLSAILPYCYFKQRRWL